VVAAPRHLRIPRHSRARSGRPSVQLPALPSPIPIRPALARPTPDRPPGTRYRPLVRVAAPSATMEHDDRLPVPVGSANN
ncbi:MAG: hypothetical protein ABJD68_18845, partial [Nakamurella sp.]